MTERRTSLPEVGRNGISVHTQAITELTDAQIPRGNITEAKITARTAFVSTMIDLHVQADNAHPAWRGNE